MSDSLRTGDLSDQDSGPAAMPADNRRDTARFALLIRPAKVVCGRLEYPCVMRDVSEEGIRIRLFHPLPDGSGYAIEMLGGERYAIQPAWFNGLAAGFRFVEPVRLDRILANAGPFPNRPVRLSIEFPATLECGERKSAVTLNNLSQQGARLTSADYLALGQLVALHSDCLPRIHAKVRWRKDDQYGVVFEETFKLAELSGLAVGIYSSTSYREQAKLSAA
ncbi:MAG: PilZ domain-containing protein [Croceibacterium sp.]